MLSKTDFMHYVECPCLLWLRKRRPDLLPPDIDEGLEQVFENGRKVDFEARRLFPGGTEISGMVFDGWDNTRKAFRSGANVLFQPTAIAGEIHARADVLTRNRRGGWDLREVKSSTTVKEDHYFDLAFQRVCFERARVPIKSTHLVHINNRYVRHGEIDPEKLFASEDVSAKVDAAVSWVKKEIPKALEVTRWAKTPGQRNVDACVDVRKCEYLGYYVKELPKDLRMKVMEERHVDPLPDPPIITIDKPAVRRALAGLRYPLHYLDYETFSPAIPMFDGYRPYQRVTFQYSMHVKPAPDARLIHAAYLEEEAVDPTVRLAAHLRKHASDKGTFVAWNAKFEMGCNTEMGERAREFAPFFRSVNARMFDPMLLFKRRHGPYQHSGFAGSASLKKVLPVLVPSLSYKTLAIQEGETASNSWPTLTDPKSPAAKHRKLYEDMLEYCGMDTMAMVRIVEHLQRL